jgi:hypothetical protein
MTINRQSMLIVAGLVAMLSGMTACHGSAPGNSGYVPASAPALPGLAQPAGQASSPIHASCKTPIKVGIQKDKTCHFNETGYKGAFSIVKNLNEIAAVRPNKGTDKIPFVIRGLKPGSGTFDVKDSQGNALHVSVTVPDAAIKSSCGKKINIHLLGVVTCQFSEVGFEDGTYTIDSSHLSGFASITPGQGTRQTQFTVTGLVEGGGYFIVHGARNLRVQVLVTTL